MAVRAVIILLLERKSFENTDSDDPPKISTRSSSTSIQATSKKRKKWKAQHDEEAETIDVENIYCPRHGAFMMGACIDKILPTVDIACYCDTDPLLLSSVVSFTAKKLGIGEKQLKSWVSCFVLFF